MHKPLIVIIAIFALQFIHSCLAQPYIYHPLHQRWGFINLEARYLGNCPQYDGNVTTVVDPFNSGYLDKWLWNSTPLQTHHGVNATETKEYNTENSFQFISGVNDFLRIRMQNVPIIARLIDGDADNVIEGDGFPNLRTWLYQSGGISTRWKYHHGKYQIRAQIPHGKTTWPAFWLFGACADEIDMFEFMQDNQSNYYHDSQISCSVHTELNCGVGQQNRETERYNLYQNMSGNMHDYSVEWDDFKIVFRVDGSIQRVFYHYYMRRNGGWIAVLNCSQVGLGSSYREDPQFSNAMLNVIMNAAIRNAAVPNQYPQNFDIENFELTEKVNCSETKTIHQKSEIVGVGYHDDYGDRTINAMKIIVQPSLPFSLVGPNSNESWNPGDLLILTATSEIQILPGFDVKWDGNLIAQIKECSTNKSLPEGEDQFPNPLPFEIIGDSIIYLSSQPEPDQQNFSPQIVPTREGFQLYGFDNIDEIEVKDLLGRRILCSAKNEDGKMKVSLEGFSTGIYLVSVKHMGQSIFATKFLYLP